MRHPLYWLMIGVAAVLGSVMTFSYLGGFLDPEGHLHDAPVGFVNADQGTSIGSVQLDAGEQVAQQVTSQGGGRVAWRVLDSQAEAERQLRDNELWGAVVVPEGFSATLAQIALAPGTASAAELQFLTNEGSGMFQPAVFDQLTATVGAVANEQVRQQIVALLDQQQTTLSPDAAATVGTPVTTSQTAVVAVSDHAGRGIAPFYLAVMITLTGFLAASVVGIGVDLRRGTERWELLGRTLPLAGAVGEDASPLRVWALKAVGTALGAGLGGLLAVMTAVWFLGMDVASAPEMYAVGVLGAIAIGMVSLVFLTLFGIAGELVGVLFTTIFGVPSAFGVYPSQALSGFFRFVGAWHPMRYLTDALRSIAFFDASGAGLGRGVVVVALWLVAGVVIGAGSAWLISRRTGPSAADDASPSHAPRPNRRFGVLHRPRPATQS